MDAVPLEEAYAEALSALGESVLMQRLLQKRLQEALALLARGADDAGNTTGT